jgi:PAS domain S-box-containing protein
MDIELTHGELEQAVEEHSVELNKAEVEINPEKSEPKPPEEASQTVHNELEARTEEQIQELLEENQQLKMQLEERIMMTEVLHENEQQFRALVANIPGAVYRFRIDSEWTIEFISDVIAEITAYPASHFKWKSALTYRDIIHPEDREKVEKAIAEGMDPQKSFSVEYRIIDATGQEHWLTENGQAVFATDGTPLWLDGTIFDITQRKKAEADLAAVQKELIENAHQAGMADIATDTLHNVGNILNSVKTSAHVIGDIMKASSLSDMKKANSMLKANIGDIEEFISNHPKGKKLMQYYLKLEEEFTKEHDNVREHLVRLTDKVKAIEDVVKAQQSYAGVSSLTESLDLSEIVEDALTIQSETQAQYNLEIVKNYQDVPKVDVNKTKLVHTLINLLQNAKDAMNEFPADKKILTFSIENDDEAVFVKVSDTGSGIPQKDIENIFSHGFTTKKNGHGFGLHSCANYMREMGGRMWAESEGEGKGATFVLRFPRRPEDV